MNFSKKNSRVKRFLACVLAAATCVGMIPTVASAAQQNSYHDPAEHWMSSVNRTNELDVNAVVTHETFLCYQCNRVTDFTTWRTPEYTQNGASAISREVIYSDGTKSDNVTKGEPMAAAPTDGGLYTGYHWSKAVCSVCGELNTNVSKDRYNYKRNVYVINTCAADFMEDLSETVTYEYLDNEYHTKTVEGGSYCGFCYGTHHTHNSSTERHNLEEKVVPQLGHQRFAVISNCKDCDYTQTKYVGAKAVIADYYGVVDGKPHTLLVSDLSEAGVTTQIRYGESAESCTLTSAPNFTEAGQYTVYYEITYTHKNTDMVQDGVAYVWLRDESTNGDGSCSCGCNDPDCGCANKDCDGNCCSSNNCGKNHKFALLDNVRPTCTTLGYDRYLCADCGKIEKRNYTNAIGHAYQSVVIRDATCENGGKTMDICRNCGDTKVTVTPKGEHAYGTSTVKATCTNPGYTVQECSICGDRHITNLTPALAHNYKSHVNPATCTSSGSTLNRCDGCGSSFISDHTAPLGHAMDEGTVVTKPSCTGEGVMKHTCTRCDATELETIPAAGHKVKEDSQATCTDPQLCTVCGAVVQSALNHDYKAVTTKPTCTEMGYTTYTCSRCGSSYKSDYVLPLGHDYDAVVTEPTCLEQGYTTYTCSRCGDQYVSDYTEPLGHKWDQGTLVTESSCTGEGVTEYRCERCDNHRLETASAEGHTPDDEATCTDPQLCTKCGVVLKKALGHDYQKEVTDPTCKEMGYTTYTCKHCGNSYKSNYILPLGHDYKAVVTKPTCLEQGYTTYTCSRCKDQYVSDYTDPLGHKWNEGKVVTEPSCTGEGATEYRCERCDYHRLETVPANGHTPGAGATCTNPQLCEKCGAVVNPALGHHYKDEVTAATCTQMGFTTHTCETCGGSYKDGYTNPTGHKLGDWIIDKEPTTDSEGSKHKECQNCGEKMDITEIPKIYNQATTNSKGKAVVGNYLVIVTDTDTKDPVANATVTLNKDGTLAIRLPNGRLIDYDDQTTVAVLKADDKTTAVPDVFIAVSDKNDNYSADKTDKDGQIVVPGKAGKTNSDGKTTFGYEDADGNRLTLTVKVIDHETNRPIEDATIKIGKTGTISVILPDGTDLDTDNRITISVTNNKNKPQEGNKIKVENDLGQKADGKTDKNGSITVPEVKNTEKHSAFFVGYTDGRFGPNDNMKRSEASAIFARLLAEKKGEVIPEASTQVKFKDIPKKSWYAGYVSYLTNYGIIYGTSDTTFDPERTITRGEFTAMAVRFFDVYGGDSDIKDQYKGFSDVSEGYWAAKYIKDAAIRGWITGYPNGAFGPHDSITRAEVSALMNRLLNRTADKDYITENFKKLKTYSDVSEKYWAYYDILEASNAHTATVDGSETWSK